MHFLYSVIIFEDNLNLNIIFGFPDPRGKYGRAVVFGHLVVGIVDLLVFVPAVVVNGSLAVVRDEGRGDASEEVVHMHMGGDPCRQLLVKERLHKGILAVGQGTDEQVRVDNLAGEAVDDVHMVSRPVDFGLVAWLMLYVHGGAPLQLVFMDVVAELRVHEGIVLVLAAFLHILVPQELLRHSDLLQVLVDVLEVWHLLVREDGIAGEEDLLELLIGHGRCFRPCDAVLAAGLERF